MRAMVRFSVKGETDGQLRNRLTAILTKAGFVLNPDVFATYEHAGLNEYLLAEVMADFWAEAMDPPNDAHVDHVWMYCDKPPVFPLQFPITGEDG